jgi:hypothetical protein
MCRFGDGRIQAAMDHDDYVIKEPVIGWLVTVVPKAPSVDTTEMKEPSTYCLVGDTARSSSTSRRLKVKRASIQTVS